MKKIVVLFLLFSPIPAQQASLFPVSPSHSSSYLITSTGQRLAASLIFASKGE
jgi:hypothetical protein